MAPAPPPPNASVQSREVERQQCMQRIRAAEVFLVLYSCRAVPNLCLNTLNVHRPGATPLASGLCVAAVLQGVGCEAFFIFLVRGGEMGAGTDGQHRAHATTTPPHPSPSPSSREWAHRRDSAKFSRVRTLTLAPPDVSTSEHTGDAASGSLNHPTTPPYTLHRRAAAHASLAAHTLFESVHKPAYIFFRLLTASAVFLSTLPQRLASRTPLARGWEAREWVGGAGPARRELRAPLSH